ncbi:MAG TPA: c-type cytochrome [Terracidiphilus sp.]
MLKRVLCMVAAAGVMMASGYANQPSQTESTTKVTIPVNRVDPTSGKQMFSSYCAPCHGQDGRGNGPVAGSLKLQPTDLTTLSKTNKGKYPDTHVIAVLKFGPNVPSHGNAQMPVWGPVLGRMGNTHIQESTLRIANLSRYLQSIQAK